MSLTSKINSLTADSNSITGASDTTLTNAVARLISGYGGGGSSSILTTKTITANGTYFAEDDNADGYSEITVSVTSGSGITKETIIPQQTLNTNIRTGNGYGAYLTNYTARPVENEYYLVTLDGNEYVAKANMYSSDSALCVGDINAVYAGSDSRLTYPFAVILTTSNTFFLTTRTSKNHTFKCEKITLNFN